MKGKELRKAKALKRSKLAALKPKKPRSEKDLLRLESYKRKQLLFLKFELYK